MEYNIVGCGGTFEYLHEGHKAFLRFVFSVGQQVYIGLTTDAFVSHYKKGEIIPFVHRKQALEAFLQQENLLSRTIIVPLDTVWGPAADNDIPIEALVVTEETIHGAERINEEREKRGLVRLPVVTMPLIEVDGHRISSTNIREGNSDLVGNFFVDKDITSATLLLPITLRETFQQPLGEVFTNEKEFYQKVDPQKAVIIGDATTIAFHHQGIYPKIAVIDFMIQRQKTQQTLLQEGFSGKEKVYTASNPAGTLTPQLWDKAKEVIQCITTDTTAVLCIEGEEDLAVVPFSLLLPLGYTIYYGQPHQGVVVVPITLDLKERMRRLIKQFDISTL